MSRENNKYGLTYARFDEVWLRISEETDIKYLKDLAVLVGVSQQFISMRRKENLFPFGWAYPVAKKYSLLGDWILSGEGPKNLASTVNKSHFENSILNEIDEWLSDLVADDKGNRTWFRIEFQNKFGMFAQWKKRRDDEESRNNSAQDSKVA